MMLYACVIGIDGEASLCVITSAAGSISTNDDDDGECRPLGRF